MAQTTEPTNTAAANIAGRRSFRPLPWLPALLAVAALLFLTLQPPNDTTKLSGSFQQWLLSLWPKGQAPGWVRDSHWVRSFAHIPEYFILGCCFYFGFSFSTAKPFVWTVAVCFGIGLLDEGLKALLPTREFDPVDLGLDLVGILVAAGLMALVFLAIRRHRRARALPCTE